MFVLSINREKARQKKSIYLEQDVIVANHGQLLSPVSSWHGYLELSNWSHCAKASREAKWQLTIDPLLLSSYTSTNRPHPLPKVLQLYSATKKNVAQNSQLPLAWIRWHAVTAGQSVANAASVNSSFVWVGVRKSNGGRMCVSESDLAFFLYSVLSFCFSGPGFRTLLHPPWKNQNASLLQLKFIWHNFSAVIFSLCICLRKILASTLHSCCDQSHHAHKSPGGPHKHKLAFKLSLSLTPHKYRQTSLYNWGDEYARPLWIMNLSLQGGLN